MRGAGHGRGELAQVIVAVLSVDDKLQTCRGELCSSSATSGVRAQAPVPVFVPYADFFQFQAGAGRAAAARAAARGDAALPREDPAPGSVRRGAVVSTDRGAVDEWVSYGVPFYGPND